MDYPSHYDTGVNNTPDSQHVQNIKVACRVRPMLNTDIGDVCVQVQNNTCIVYSENNKQKFDFDNVFDLNSKQEDLFELARTSVIDNVLEKQQNGTIFSFGRSCSGKTYTVMGLADQNRGIVPRTVEYVFDYFERHKSSTKQFFISISFLELYMERVRDLLNQEQMNLEVLDSDNPVPDATEIQVSTPDEIFTALDHGNAFKVMAPNKINQQSSRSHCILILNILQRDLVSNTYCLSKLVLADLAGSEKISRTEAEGLRLSEAKNINKSLLALGKVVNALTTHQTHIPYRDSKLTRLLKCSLGGNSKTLLIVHISPTQDALQESLSTLLFASRAKSVRNVLRTNQFYCVETALSQELLNARGIIRALYSGQIVQRRTLEPYLNNLTDSEFLRQFGAVQGPQNIVNNDNTGLSMKEPSALSPELSNNISVMDVGDNSEQTSSEKNRYHAAQIQYEQLQKLQEDSELLKIIYHKSGYDMRMEVDCGIQDICSLVSDDIFGAVRLSSSSLLRRILKTISASRLDSLDDEGHTPLTYAIYTGFYTAVEMLIDAGADAWLKDGNGDTPLSMLIQTMKGTSEQLQIFDLLISIPGSPGMQRNSDSSAHLDYDDDRLNELSTAQSDLKQDNGEDNLIRLLLTNNVSCGQEIKAYVLQQLLEKQIPIKSEKDKWYATLECVNQKDQKSLQVILTYIVDNYQISSKILQSSGICQAFHQTIKLQNKYMFLTIIKVQQFQSLLINSRQNDLTALELAFQVHNLDAFEYMLKLGANYDQNLINNIFLLGNQTFCSIIMKCCIQNNSQIDINQIFVALLSHGNVKNIELLLTKCNYRINQNILTLTEKMHGKGSQIYQFINKLLQPQIQYENAQVDNLIVQFENFLEELANKKQFSIQKLQAFKNLQNYANKQIIMKKHNVNYVEYLYLKKYNNVQSIRQITDFIGVQQLDFNKLRSIVKYKQQSDWMQFLNEF